MSRPQKIVVEHLPASPLLRHFNVTRELSEEAVTDFSFPIGNPNTSYALKCIGEVGKRLLVTLQDRVEGLSYCRLTRYSLELTINVAFDWDDVEPDVLQVIRELFGDENFEVRRLVVDPVLGISIPIEVEEADEPETAEAEDLGAKPDRSEAWQAHLRRRMGEVAVAHADDAPDPNYPDPHDVPRE